MNSFITNALLTHFLEKDERELTLPEKCYIAYTYPTCNSATVTNIFIKTKLKEDKDIFSLFFLLKCKRNFYFLSDYPLSDKEDVFTVFLNEMEIHLSPEDLELLYSYTNIDIWINVLYELFQKKKDIISIIEYKSPIGQVKPFHTNATKYRIREILDYGNSGYVLK